MLLLLHIRKVLQKEDCSMWLLLYLCLMSTQMISFIYEKGPVFQARPRYREGVSSTSSLLPVKGLHEQLDAVHTKEPLIRTPSEKKKALNSALIWENFFKACENIGKELLKNGFIGILDLEAWKTSKSKIVHIGIPAYAFLECFFRSIKSDSPGFVMRDNVEITSLNRPEGRIFDWLFEPMSIMKEQLKSLNLVENEELFLYKFCLYNGDAVRIEAWHNGGFPPQNEIRRAQLEGVGRRLQGFCLTLSRLPTSRRRFYEVVKELEEEAKWQSNSWGAGSDLGAAV